MKIKIEVTASYPTQIPSSAIMALFQEIDKHLGGYGFQDVMITLQHEEE